MSKTTKLTRGHHTVHDEAQRLLEGFGERIREARKARNLSQTGFAALIGVSNKTLDNIEAGRNWPSMPVYIIICKVLDAPKPTFIQ